MDNFLLFDLFDGGLSLIGKRTKEKNETLFEFLNI